MEKVSVIVPVYNIEQYLEECLKGLINQTYDNIEIIVIDDGSSDGTYKLALNIAKKDSRIKVIHQEHRGVSAARNNGLKQFSGDLVTFVDGDDSIEPNYIKHLVDQLHHFDSDIAVSFYKLHDEQTGQFLVLMNPAPGNNNYNGVYSPEQWLKNIGPVLNAEANSVWGKIYKRKIFNHLRFPEEFSFFEDGLTWWKACLGAKKISFLNEIDYTYRTSCKNLIKTPADQLEAAKEVVQSLEEQMTMMDVLGLDTTYLSGNLKDSLNNLKNKALAVSDYDYYQRAASALEVLRKIEERSINMNKDKAVVLSGDYKYDDQITTTIKSIAYHIKNVKIYLINFDIPQEYFFSINHYLNQMGSKLIDLKINPEIFNDEEAPKAHISKITYGRLLIPRLVSEDRVLYIDSDAIVNQNIDELWSINFEGHPIAAVHDVFVGDRFNAGIMLINNKKLKQDDSIVDRLLDAGKQEGISDADQTVLNQFFNHKYLELGLEYNYVIGYDRDVSLLPSNAPGYFDAIANCKDPKIIHYASPDKPWNLTSSGRMRERWWQYHDLDWLTIISHGKLPDLNKHPRGEFLTVTKSDSMIHLAEIAQALPDFEFHVAAFTLVSPTLLNYMRFHNVHVYPIISSPRMEELISNCSAYLDINQGGKFTDIINRFTQDDRKVYSFANEKARIDNENNQFVFDDDDYQSMINKIKANS